MRRVLHRRTRPQLQNSRLPGPTSLSEADSIAPDLEPICKWLAQFICDLLHTSNKLVALWRQHTANSALFDGKLTLLLVFGAIAFAENTQKLKALCEWHCGCPRKDTFFGAYRAVRS